MAKKTETSVEEKLRALFDLQLIDSRIDQIRSIRGELPLEVEDLENEITGLNKRLEDYQKESEKRHEELISTLNKERRGTKLLIFLTLVIFFSLFLTWTIK